MAHVIQIHRSRRRYSSLLQSWRREGGVRTNLDGSYDSHPNPTRPRWPYRFWQCGALDGSVTRSCGESWLPHDKTTAVTRLPSPLAQVGERLIRLARVESLSCLRASPVLSPSLQRSWSSCSWRTKPRGRHLLWCSPKAVWRRMCSRASPQVAASHTEAYGAALASCGRSTQPGTWRRWTLLRHTGARMPTAAP